MITLKTEKYCEDCPDFEPEVNKSVIRMSDFCDGGSISCNTLITCKHKDRCKCIYDEAYTKVKEESSLINESQESKQ